MKGRGYESYSEVAAKRKDSKPPEPNHAERERKREKLDHLSSELFGTLDIYERCDPEDLTDEQIDRLAACDIQELLEQAQRLGSLLGQYEAVVSDE